MVTFKPCSKPNVMNRISWYWNRESLTVKVSPWNTSSASAKSSSCVFKFDARLLSDHVKATFILYIQIVNTSIVLNHCWRHIMRSFRTNNTPLQGNVSDSINGVRSTLFSIITHQWVEMQGLHLRFFGQIESDCSQPIHFTKRVCKWKFKTKYFRLTDSVLRNILNDRFVCMLRYRSVVPLSLGYTWRNY